jgi:hypothetical protein
MKTDVLGEPEIEGGEVVLRIAVDDARSDEGGMFICRMTDFDTISVEPFLSQTPNPDAESRVAAATAARRHARENREQFEMLFAKL